MEIDDAITVALAEWEQSFRDAAEADDCAAFEELLSSLDLPGDPDMVLDGTVLFVQRCVAYMTLDGQQVMDFLAQQHYDPRKAVDAPYRVTFDLQGKAYPCVTLPASLRPVDLADLYGAPWNEYRVVGFCDFWIARADGVALSAKEIAGFDEAVEYDLRFDYGEDEVSFWSNPDTHDGRLKFTVQDVYDFEEDKENDEDEEEDVQSIATDLDDTSTTGSK